LLDFFHVTEYLAKVAYPAHRKNRQTLWLDTRCQQINHEAGAVEALISDMEKLSKKTS
jgi:hypothetical protein